jgi:glutaconate CoA-transferase subunit B
MSAASTSFTLGELMVAAAAREIKDGEIAFIGMRLPLIAFVVAKRTHAPNAVGLFENGVVRTTPSPELIYTMADPPNILGATQCLEMMSVMALLQSGKVDLGFLGAAEVDRFGNLNSTEVRTADKYVRLPGSGGACDIASCAKRFVAMIDHEKHRLPEKVSYITSPGNGTGAGWRRRVGLPRGGPGAVITTRAVLRFGEDGEAYLDTHHLGVSINDVKSHTGWDLKVGPNAHETEAPSVAELKAIREYDTKGFWTS